MDIVERLRWCGLGFPKFKTNRGDYGICDDAADEIERLREENKLLFDLFHEAVALPQGKCPRSSTAGDGMFNPQHKALGEKE
jgi:hypothetical protein